MIYLKESDLGHRKISIEHFQRLKVISKRSDIPIFDDRNYVGLSYVSDQIAVLYA